jgi:hypothetical protein
VLGSMRETGVLGSGIGEGADFVMEDGGGTDVSNRDDETGDGKRVDNGNNGTKVVEDGGAWDEDFAADAVTAARHRTRQRILISRLSRRSIQVKHTVRLNAADGHYQIVRFSKLVRYLLVQPFIWTIASSNNDRYFKARAPIQEVWKFAFDIWTFSDICFNSCWKVSRLEHGSDLFSKLTPRHVYD